MAKTSSSSTWLMDTLFLPGVHQHPVKGRGTLIVSLGVKLAVWKQPFEEKPWKRWRNLSNPKNAKLERPTFLRRNARLELSNAKLERPAFLQRNVRLKFLKRLNAKLAFS